MSESLSRSVSSSASGSSYRQLFAARGSVRFFVAGLIARFPSGMMTLSIVMMLTHSRTNYSLPSLVASTAILSNALLAPQLSRLADRYGQSRIALPAMGVAVAAFVALMLGARLMWADWALFVCAVGAGCIPNFGAFSRARWSHVYSGTPYLRAPDRDLVHDAAFSRGGNRGGGTVIYLGRAGVLFATEE